MNSYLSQGKPDLASINRLGEAGIEGRLGIRFTAIGPDFICADMPVDERTVQPYGLLHGGASIVLAESLGSYASTLLVSDEKDTRIAGIEVSGSHVKAVRSGRIAGVARPVSLGRSLHFWRIDIRDEGGALTCSAKLTVKVSRSAETGRS